MLPVLSSIVVILAGSLIVLALMIRLIVRAAKKQEVPWKACLAGTLAVLALTTWSGISLFFQTISCAREKLPEAARNAVSEVVHQETTAVMEGLGKTGDHFGEKWKQEAKQDLSLLVITCRGVKVTEGPEEGKASCDLELVVENPTDRDLDLRDIVRIGMPLLEDDEGLSHLPSADSLTEEQRLPARTKTRQTVRYRGLDAGIRPAFVVCGGGRKAPVSGPAK